MGAWGIQSFENDDALDWCNELTEADASVLAVALSSIIASEEAYLEVPECSIAVAAAEVVAALRGNPALDLPNNILSLVERVGGRYDDALVEMARNAVKKIEGHSELQELWDEGNEGSQWHGAMRDLSNRLEREIGTGRIKRRIANK